jgi:two-component system, chemotaxis family, sensor kinase CheA
MNLAHLISEFVAEAQEHLATAEEDALTLEHAGICDGEETLNRLFRALHTIKGGAACVEFDGIKAFAHEMESVAGLLRDGKLVATPELSHLLLEGLDKLKAGVLSGNGTIDDPDPVLARLQQAVRQPASNVLIGAAAKSSCANFDLCAIDTRAVRAEGMHVFDITIDVEKECKRLGCTPAGLYELMGSIGTVLASCPEAAAFKTSPNVLSIASVLLASIIDDPEILFPGLGIEPLSFVHYAPEQLPDHVPAPIVAPPPPAPASVSIPAKSPAAPPRSPEKMLRIPVEIADNLMNLAGELVVVRNRSQQLQASGNAGEISAMNQRLNVVTSDLQRMVMRTRMQPVGNVFGRFTRVVRDLGRSLGKEIEVEITGSEVELDKSIIDGVVEPLMHLVRNSVDHGIESPEERKRCGKSAVGLIRLVAEHQAGLVNIMVIDDGKGIDPKKLRQAAVEKGLMPQHQADALSDREALHLIFLPGFSTAKEISEISGRGVGMDVVRASLQKLGGVVEIQSIAGKGSTISIRLPLTLAIIPAIILATGGQSFAIPQVNVLEVVWLHGDQVYQAIQKIEESEVYWLRGRVLPLIRLSTVLQIPQTFVDPELEDERQERRRMASDRRQAGPDSHEDRRSGIVDRRVSPENSLYIIVLRIGSDRIGLCVEDIVDTEEIVVKPLHGRLKESEVYAGVTVLGDGTTAMILDVPELARVGGVRSDNAETRLEVARIGSSEPQKMLVFTNGLEHFAVPLSLLMRVDEIGPGDIQTLAGREFLRFRDSVIPLVRIESVIPSVQSRYDDADLHVIIPRIGNPVAILVSQIVDIVEIDNDALVHSTGQEAIIGTQVIQGYATSLLDLCALAASVDPVHPGHERDTRGKCILVVEDSTLYTALVTSVFHGHGYEVITAENGREALHVLGQHAVDCIVSDIEMPVMDGLELARQLKVNPSTRGIPLVGMSMIEEKVMRSRTLSAGFDDFCSKSDLPRLGELVNALLLPTSSMRAEHA